MSKIMSQTNTTHDKTMPSAYADATHVDQVRSLSALRSVGLWPPPTRDRQRDRRKR